MDIIDAMDGHNWITYILNCIMGKYMFRKHSKAHRCILFILQSMERRDLITIYFWPSWGVEVRWGDLFILPEKKNRIQNSVEKNWVTATQVLSWKWVQFSDEYVS